MENCLYSGWAEEADCTQCDAAPVLPWLPPPHVSASFQFHGFPSWSLPVEKMATEDRSDERTATASKSHSQAEKRRRDRINAQLATLRKLIPKSEKVLHLFSFDHPFFLDYLSQPMSGILVFMHVFRYYLEN